MLIKVCCDINGGRYFEIEVGGGACLISDSLSSLLRDLKNIYKIDFFKPINLN